MILFWKISDEAETPMGSRWYEYFPQGVIIVHSSCACGESNRVVTHVEVEGSSVLKSLKIL